MIERIRPGEHLVLTGPFQLMDDNLGLIYTPVGEELEFFQGKEVLIRTQLSKNIGTGIVYHDFHEVYSYKKLIFNLESLSYPEEAKDSDSLNEKDIVQIIGPVNTRNGKYSSYYWNEPTSGGTDRFKGKVGEITKVYGGGNNSGYTHFQIEIKGPRNGKPNTVVCWPSSVKPVFTM
jgi:hypothetical protein